VSVFSSLDPPAVAIDGVETGFARDEERGLAVTEKFVNIPSGATATFVFEFSGPLDLSLRYRLTTRSPVLAHAMEIAVRTTARDTVVELSRGTSTRSYSVVSSANGARGHRARRHRG
jgi:hypothetical protein